MKSEIEGTYPSGELQGGLINELEEELHEAKQKLESLIAELEGLQRYDICNGKYIFYADIEALIDKYKGEDK